MTPNREGFLSTIRALMEMTEARGCTREEAAIARAKARQLMDKRGVRKWTWEPFRRAGRVLAGYVAVGYGIWTIAAFDITPSQQDRPYKYGQGVSNAEEPGLSHDFSSQARAEISKLEQEHDGLQAVHPSRREPFKSEDGSDPAMIGSR